LWSSICVCCCGLLDWMCRPAMPRVVAQCCSSSLIYCGLLSTQITSGSSSHSRLQPRARVTRVAGKENSNLHITPMIWASVNLLFFIRISSSENTEKIPLPNPSCFWGDYPGILCLGEDYGNLIVGIGGTFALSDRAFSPVTPRRNEKQHRFPDSFLRDDLWQPFVVRVLLIRRMREVVCE
jgi:hypothetical protein